jgi:hypothetical protein
MLLVEQFEILSAAHNFNSDPLKIQIINKCNLALPGIRTLGPWGFKSAMLSTEPFTKVDLKTHLKSSLWHSSN